MVGCINQDAATVIIMLGPFQVSANGRSAMWIFAVDSAAGSAHQCTTSFATKLTLDANSGQKHYLPVEICLKWGFRFFALFT